MQPTCAQAHNHTVTPSLRQKQSHFLISKTFDILLTLEKTQNQKNQNLIVT